jgi:GT2 family glycosyltransferase
MVDTDMGFTKDTVDRLVASADKHDRPVVGGLCFALRGAPKQVTPLNGLRYRIVPTVYEYRELEDDRGFTPIFDYPRNQLMQVHGTGAACLLIHRTVLEDMGGKYDTWFQTIHDGDRNYSEDLSFCMRLALMGVPLFVDTAVKTTHDKGGLFLDEETYDQWRATA